MPRPVIENVTFTIDGREVTAPGGAMLVDAAKYGDVEIPVFCYEPKLGQPVGACRMCLVEVEGIPKLQTACSTPVKDGMVVHTQTQRVHDAQRGVVEFLLINHPLDCPVCDKGGECPLQDITYGWGPGTSRFIEPKRHFKKPLELSPLVAIDRERCILCYRCVRYSQEVAEDYQLVLHERGASTYVGTFDGHPYVAPFSGNIVELCPVGALTNSAYRFRARPWDIEGAGSVCTLCPSQCNVELTVRDDRVQRVLARDNPAVDDGWLCDKGRWGYQHAHADERITQPLVRDGGVLRPASWERALDAAASALTKAGGSIAGLAEGETTNEEAFLAAKLLRGLGASVLASGPSEPLGDDPFHPAFQATVPDLEFAHAVLLLDCDPIDEAPIWDLRIRKGVRRHGVQLAVAGARPSALDPNAAAIVRTAPGSAEALLVALDAALSGDDGNLGGAASAAGSNAQSVRDLADLLRGRRPVAGGYPGAGGEAGDGPRDVVIVASERTLTPGGARALVNVAARLGLDREGAGVLIAPASTNARGIRESGFGGSGGAAVAGAASTVLYLMHSDPLRDHPDRAAWERALAGAGTVIAHESVLTETVREHADVVFPAEAYPEKEGTLTHPDGLLQRLRPGIGRPGSLEEGVRAGWSVLAELARRCDVDLGRVLAASMVSQQLFAEVYPGMTLDLIAGHGARPERAAGDAPAPQPLEVPRTTSAGGLKIGTWRPLWAAKEVDLSPHLQFARAQQVVELSPGDAERLGVGDGDVVEVAANGTAVRGPVKLRAAVPAGSVFVAVGTEDSPGNVIGDAPVEVRALAGVTAGPVAETVAGGGDEAPEPPASETPAAPA